MGDVSEQQGTWCAGSSSDRNTYSERAGQLLLTHKSLCLFLETDEICLTIIRMDKEIRTPRIFLSQIKTYKETIIILLKQIIAHKSIHC